MCSLPCELVVELQGTLLGAGEPARDPNAGWEMIMLGDGSWLNVSRGWMLGCDTLLEQLAATVPWRQGRRRMYDRVLDDPRLSCWYPAGAPLPHPVLDRARDNIASHYDLPLRSLALNYYRDGRDSVAPHRDRELRKLDDTLVAIVTLGARRPFLVRGRAGGRSRDLAPAGGDLLVMGGACQREWEHAVPKVKRAGPRISATWRWSSGRDTEDQR